MKLNLFKIVQNQLVILNYLSIKLNYLEEEKEDNICQEIDLSTKIKKEIDK